MNRRSTQIAHLNNAYGITIDDYDAMLEAQDYRCAICNEMEERKRDDGTEQPLSVDHDHATGRVRGLLCHRCNTALGLFRDSKDVLERALEYVGGGAATCRSK